MGVLSGGEPNTGGDAGDKDDAGDAGKTGNDPIVNTGTGEKDATGGDNDWRTTIPEDIRSSPSLMKFQKPEDVYRSYVNLEKQWGADKVSIPGKHATPDDWHAFYQKTGLPAGVENYKMEFPKESNKDYTNALVETAYKAGTPSSSVTNPSVDDIYMVKLRGGINYAVVKITAVTTGFGAGTCTMGGDTGRIQFEYKK